MFNRGMLQTGLKRNNGNREEECQKACKAEWYAQAELKTTQCPL